MNALALQIVRIGVQNIDVTVLVYINGESWKEVLMDIEWILI